MTKDQENKIREEWHVKSVNMANTVTDYSKVEDMIADFFLTKMKELEIPLGVSQWKDYGIKYGYWQYFEDKTKEHIDIAVRERDKEIENEVCQHIARFYPTQKANIINGFVRGAIVNLSTSPKE